MIMLIYISTFRVFLAFFWAKMTKAVLLSDSLEASFEFPPKLLSHEEELHDRVEAVVAIATPKATHCHWLLSLSFASLILVFLMILSLYGCVFVLLQSLTFLFVLAFWPPYNRETPMFPTCKFRIALMPSCWCALYANWVWVGLEA